jgi:hypothetical protein
MNSELIRFRILCIQNRFRNCMRKRMDNEFASNLGILTLSKIDFELIMCFTCFQLGDVFAWLYLSQLSVLNITCIRLQVNSMWHISDLKVLCSLWKGGSASNQALTHKLGLHWVHKFVGTMERGGRLLLFSFQLLYEKKKELVAVSSHDLSILAFPCRHGCRLHLLSVGGCHRCRG